MCGVLGIWDQRSGRHLAVPARRMAQLLRHRGPDDEGFALVSTGTLDVTSCSGPDTADGVRLPPLSDELAAGADLVLGARRLAVLDLSAAGHQPVVTPGGTVLAYNGEVYNFRELRAELATSGTSFVGSGDTEVVAAAYEAWGPSFVTRLNGMFAMAIWDPRRRHLLLATDRFGIKPLYWTHRDGVLAFASEIKALVSSGVTSTTPDEETLSQFLELGTGDGSARTFFADVRRLTGGTMIVATRSTDPSPQQWWTPSGGAEAQPWAQAAAAARHRVRRAVERSLVSDMPVGSCLSGGLDSSTIVGHIARHHEDSLTQIVVNASAEDPTIDEKPYVAAVAAHTGARAHFVSPTATGLWHTLPLLAWYQDEPFTSTSVYAQWCVMGRARELGVTVMLDGQGADELFGGYPKHVTAELTSSLTHGRALRFLADLRTWRSSGSANAAATSARVIAGRLLEQSRCRTPRRTLRQELDQQLMSTSLPRLLRYEDRNSMAHSIEARVPYLDTELVDHMVSVPERHLLHGGWRKSLLRYAADGVVPDAVRDRRDKVAFATTEPAWLAALDDEIVALCTSPRARVPRLLGGAAWQTARSAGGTSRLWRYISVEAWLRTFFDEEGSTVRRSVPSGDDLLDD